MLLLMSISKRLTLFLLLLLCFATRLPAAEKWALLVGINNYQNDISQLRFCVADVEAFGQSLVEVAGFKAKNVHLMTDNGAAEDQPTHVNVIKRLGILASRIQPDDTFIFYFSGHGISKTGRSFLLASNSDSTTVDTLEITAIPLQKVNEIISRVKAKQVLSIIDACRNDPNSGRGDQDNVLDDTFARGFKVKPNKGSSGLPGVNATLYACSVGERAYEWSDKEHGVFSYYLLQGLRGRAVNDKGQVTITDLANYTQQQVVDWAQTYRGKQQTPWLSLQGSARLVLAENVEPSVLAAENLARPNPIGANPPAQRGWLRFKRYIVGGSVASIGTAALLLLLKKSADDSPETTTVDIEITLP
jgi:uncharacterized caspase-like protein